MDDTQFWAIIESGGPEALDNPDAQLAAVRAQLLLLTPDQIIEFSAELGYPVAKRRSYVQEAQ